MHDEDDDDDGCDGAAAPPPRKWSWLYLWSIGVAGSAGWFRLISAMLVDVSNAMDSHGEWKREKAKFQERAGLEIEALTRESSTVGG